MSDPFGLPVRTIGSLLRYEPNTTFRHRVHVRGRVTLQWPGRSLCIQDATRGLCAQTAETTPLGVGDLVDVAGFPGGGGFAPTMTDATSRLAGAGQLILPAPVTAAQALRGDHDSALVQVEGQLIGQDHTGVEPTLAILSGNTLFAGVLPRTMTGDAAPHLSEAVRFALLESVPCKSPHSKWRWERALCDPSRFGSCCGRPAMLSPWNRPPGGIGSARWRRSPWLWWWP